MKHLYVCGLAIVIAGCGPSKPAPVQDVILTPAAQIAKKPLPEPDFSLVSPLGLVRPTGTVRVGDDRASALKIFAAPVGSYEQDDPPPSIPEPYSARGWQTEDEGFGVILYEGKLAAAVHQLTREDAERADEIFEMHRNAFGAPNEQIVGRRVRYWFWVDAAHRQQLMICAFEATPGKFNITSAIGTDRVMQALGMTQDAASREQKRVDDLLEKQQNGKNGKRSD